MKQLSILLLLFLLQFLYDGQAAVAAAQCKGLGQYCTAHSDCCSNSCLSFSYKCVERHHGPHKQSDVDVASTASVAKPTTMKNIDEVVERFGGSDATTKTYQTNVMPSTMLPVETNQSVSQATNDIGHNDGNCRANGLLCLNSDQCCSDFCSKITNLCIAPTPDSLSTEQMTFTRPVNLNNEPEPCFGIGHKCYATGSIECCPPLRCHGYLHQCVT